MLDPGMEQQGKQNPPSPSRNGQLDEEGRCVQQEGSPCIIPADAEETEAGRG